MRKTDFIDERFKFDVQTTKIVGFTTIRAELTTAFSNLIDTHNLIKTYNYEIRFKQASRFKCNSIGVKRESGDHSDLDRTRICDRPL